MAMCVSVCAVLFVSERPRARAAQLLRMGVSVRGIREFPFIERPAPEAIARAVQRLVDIGAVGRTE